VPPNPAQDVQVTHKDRSRAVLRIEEARLLPLRVAHYLQQQPDCGLQHISEVIFIFGKQEEAPQQLAVPVAPRVSPGTFDEPVLSFRFSAEIVKRVSSGIVQRQVRHVLLDLPPCILQLAISGFVRRAQSTGGGE
jgi:hypothetical protein